MLYLPLNNDERLVGWSVAVPAESFLADPKGAHAYLVGITLRACQIARSAAANAAEAVGTNVPDLYEAVENCEKELDQLDRELDQRICAALENATALQRGEMLACMKCMTDLERIGDLVLSFVSGSQALRARLGNDDVYELMRMALLLERMLNDVYHAFSTRDLNRALTVLRTDSEIDRLRKVLFVRHVDSPGSEPRAESVQVLLMAQGLERAGDHAKNLAEEVCHFVSGYTLRHVIQKDHGSYEQCCWIGCGSIDQIRTELQLR